MNKDEIITLLKKEIIEHLKKYNKEEIQALRNIYSHVASELFYILTLATNRDYNEVRKELFNEYEKEIEKNEKNWYYKKL